MFRNPLHPIIRLLTAFSLSIAAAAPAAPAAAAPDVTGVSFTVTIAGVPGGGSPDVSAEIRVQGSGLNNGTITLPSVPGSPIALQADGADLARTILFANEADLNTNFGAGSYALSLNNGTVTADIAYEARPAVPSPDIQAPDQGAVIAPGPVEVLFTACPVCNLGLDSVRALLEDGAANELASDVLGSGDDHWIPSDGMGGSLQLGEGGDFVVTITHTAVRQKNVAANDADGSFGFSGVFVQSDAVAFETGFETPVGDFCLVVNLPDPPPACGFASDPTLSILDPSGLVSTTVNGLDVDYTVEVDTRGRITGEASADLDDDTTPETSAPLTGKLKGKSGEAKQKLSFRLQNDGLEAKLKVLVSDVLSIPDDLLTRLQKASGTLGGTKLKEETPQSLSPLPVAAQGWRLDFVLDGSKTVESATLTLEGGRSFPLVGTSKFNLARNLSTLKLQTGDKGVKIQLKKLGLEAEALPKLTGVDLRYRILGQSGGATLP